MNLILIGKEMNKLIKKRKYNDKWVLGIKPYSGLEVDNYLYLVLCYLPTNEITPYVTWIYNKSDKGFHSGHYHERINNAIPEFLTRGGKSVCFNDEWIRQHDAIETHYVQLVSDGSWEECDAENAQMISVYMIHIHKLKERIECITDHYDPKDAMRIVRWISNKYEMPIMYQPKDIHYTKLKPIN
jgi:hypothetical protein